MNDQIEQIAQRLKGLRDALDASVEDFAKTAGISKEEYESYESGKKDISISLLQSICRQYGVEMTAILFGDEPHVESYYLTRAGQGIAMERTKAYQYNSLGAGFKNRKADPFIVTVEAKPDDTPIHLNSHAGQEFNMVLEGTLQLTINGKELILHEGDSIYFNSGLEHGMKALNGKTVKFLAVIL